MQIRVARGGKELGVFSLEEINRQLAAGTLSLMDHAWYEGATGWAALSTVPGVNAAPATNIPLRKTEQLATLSLIFSVMGLLGFCCALFLVAGVAGIICGHIALSRIKTDPTLEGHGLAMAGVIIGYIGVAVWVAWILLFGGLAVLQGISEGAMKH